MKNNIKLSLIIIAALSIISATCLAAFTLINPLNIQNLNFSPIILTMSLINSWLIIAMFVYLFNSISSLKKNLDEIIKPKPNEIIKHKPIEIKTKIYDLSKENNINSIFDVIEGLEGLSPLSNYNPHNLSELSIEQLEIEMNSAVEKNDFEKAAVIRDIISKKSSENL